MKDRDLEKLFEETNFDIHEPNEGHRARFTERLRKNKEQKNSSGKLRKLWMPIMSIAATLLIAFVLIGDFSVQGANKKVDLASVSPEMKETQDFYSGMIRRELNRIDSERTPETKKIIDDAMSQMERLESEYDDLKQDLANSGKDNRVIYAMIQNFQKRIDLLNNVLDKIETIKELKKQHHENNII